MKKTLFILLALTTTVSFAQFTFVGMSSQGGFSNSGTIFNIDTDGHFAVQYNFNEGIDGYAPMGSLVEDGDGNFYGLTSKGGFNENGTIFKYRKNDKKITTLATFGGITGGSPMGSLILCANGKLYGMTDSDGVYSKGTIFECTTQGHLTTLVNFDKTNGANPVGKLTEAKDGSLYGMTRSGGEYNYGVIFKCSQAGEITVIHNFTGKDGGEPYGSLTIVNNGILYGLTHNGGDSNEGVIFYCTLNGNYKILQSFTHATGTLPCGNLLNTVEGYLYGTTYAGGKSNCGTLFRCDYWGKIEVLANFNDSIGTYPMGSLSIAGNGNIYGVTSAGGGTTHANAGVIFKYNTYGGKLTRVYEFSSAGPKGCQSELVESNKNINSKKSRGIFGR